MYSSSPVIAARRPLAAPPSAAPPVEYAVAVDQFLAAASLGAASRRVYRISLASWAWMLVRRPPAMRPALTGEQVARLFGVLVGLREQAFWRVLYDAGGRAEEVLALDAGRLDLSGNRARIDPPQRAWAAGAPAAWIRWQTSTTQMLSWLIAGRACGPVFLTGRRAPAGAASADVCPLTGRARMSYRRAAEIFTAATRPLDPAGRGWTLHQLSLAGLAVR